MGLFMHHRAGYKARTFAMLAGAVLSLVASMVIGFAAGQADAASGGGGGTPYAPKVYVLGNATYSGDETITRTSTLTIERSWYYKIMGGDPFARVLVQPGVTADVVMENLNIDVSVASGVANASPFQIRPGATVTLRLAGENTLRAIGTSAAIEAPEGATLVITSAKGDGSLSGSLTAFSEYGAGIGGASGQAGGSITINGGAVSADVTGGDWSAACIGGGGGDDRENTSGSNPNDTFDAGQAGDITITGGII